MMERYTSAMAIQPTIPVRYVATTRHPVFLIFPAKVATRVFKYPTRSRIPDSRRATNAREKVHIIPWIPPRFTRVSTMALPVSIWMPLFSRFTKSTRDTPCCTTAIRPPVNTPIRSAGMEGNLMALRTRTSTTGIRVSGLITKAEFKDVRISLVVAAS